MPTLPEPLQRTAQSIARTQRPDGAIPWFDGGKLDPWDHTEAAMGLNVAGYHKAAERAFLWLAENQLHDGSWHAQYFVEDAADNTHPTDQPADLLEKPLRETHFSAYIATGVWHHFLCTGDEAFLRAVFPCVAAAMDFVIAQQTPHGDIAWAVDAAGRPQDDALVTACASILHSLDCANRIAQHLHQDKPHWRDGAARLAHCLRHRPERFDRTWPSKARFAMDWYYPVLAGIYSAPEARQRLAARWTEFVEPGLGCRCVNDEPWVTMAETSELIIALCACGETQKAAALFATLAQWRDEQDGSYWTGYVFRDRAIWPAEKTTWTAGAVLLAADALMQLTPAAQLFHPLRENGA